MKNRMREICTSGSVRGGGGNVPTYSAIDVPQWPHVLSKRGCLGERGKLTEELQGARIEGCRQALEEEATVSPREDAH
jgi:hypothetical protein